MSTQPNEIVRERSELEHIHDERRLTPPVDVYENKDELLLLIDVPGVENEGLSIQLDGERLEVEARQRLAEGDPQGLPPAVYVRTFAVPRGIDASKVNAALERGVLAVHLPKSEASKPRRIAVKTG